MRTRQCLVCAEGRLAATERETVRTGRRVGQAAGFTAASLSIVLDETAILRIYPARRVSCMQGPCQSPIMTRGTLRGTRAKSHRQRTRGNLHSVTWPPAEPPPQRMHSRQPLVGRRELLWQLTLALSETRRQRRAVTPPQPRRCRWRYSPQSLARVWRCSKNCF
jgi:hypothetical protein